MQLTEPVARDAHPVSPGTLQVAARAVEMARVSSAALELYGSFFLDG